MKWIRTEQVDEATVWITDLEVDENDSFIIPRDFLVRLLTEAGYLPEVSGNEEES